MTIQKEIGATPDGHFGPQTAFKLGKHLGMDIIEASHFIGQCAVETGWFTQFTENMNYSAKQLSRVFSAFRDPLVALQYQNQPELIANRAYANRNGNGDEASGDGWKFRGRGMIMLTGFSNYLQASRRMGNDEVVNNPESAANWPLVLDTATSFWKKRRIKEACKSTSIDSCRAVTSLINGPALLHLQERHQATLKVHRWLTNLNY